jgi:hypothetical protein
MTAMQVIASLSDRTERGITWRLTRVAPDGGWCNPEPPLVNAIRWADRGIIFNPSLVEYGVCGESASPIPAFSDHPEPGEARAFSYSADRSTHRLARPGKPGALQARPDGIVLEGHHRLVVLRERGVDIDGLPRELLPREPES